MSCGNGLQLGDDRAVSVLVELEVGKVQVAFASYREQFTVGVRAGGGVSRGHGP